MSARVIFFLISLFKFRVGGLTEDLLDLFLIMETTGEVCTSILVSVNKVKYSYGNPESGVHKVL